ncbi:hypothetical protein PAP_06555 [Palaeococcus pacificus DY20341]|uniref:Uncharacterized protein n=1 Tax=Palaeococcus pacificus DY20341 TaxID=1343739 RepID=A0A075LYQ7_9EURY|nr:hypothetical protein [Palaeococcus pacificus]AIF69708.1 hypothetical protein PAP_06555 [Palaeococcus pacificus DY20341]
MWKKRLKETGVLTTGEFLIEVSVDSECPCKDDELYPSILVYDSKSEEWYYIDEPFEPVRNFREAFEEAVEILEEYMDGKPPRLKRSPKVFAPSEVVERFVKALNRLKS